MSASKTPVTSDPRLRLAAALLMHYGELSIAEIEALPFVNSREIAEMLAIELARRLGAERVQRRTTAPVVSRWEDVICLPSLRVEDADEDEDDLRALRAAMREEEGRPWDDVKRELGI